MTFTCGCNQGAGLITTNANGSYTITSTAPAVGGGTYTLQGHNVLIVGYATGSHTQAWTMNFVGTSPSNDLNLSSTPSNMSANGSDAAAAAASLYLFYEVQNNATIANSSDRTFDWFNFNTVDAWAQHLRTAPTSAEAKLLSDVSAAQSSGTSLFPYKPGWLPSSQSADGTNGTIATDLSAVASGGIAADAGLPTPCPAANQCTGAPTP